MTATEAKAMGTRLLLRMECSLHLPKRRPPQGTSIRTYAPSRDQGAIRQVYAAAFQDDPWPADWHEFAEFDAKGVFVARAGSAVVGYAISFQRDDFGYISVVAVRPEHQRRGIATALIAAAARYLRGRGLDTIRIDAFGDSPPAVATYWALGFRIYAIALEPVGEP